MGTADIAPSSDAPASHHGLTTNNRELNVLTIHEASVDNDLTVRRNFMGLWLAPAPSIIGVLSHTVDVAKITRHIASAVTRLGRPNRLHGRPSYSSMVRWTTTDGA